MLLWLHLLVESNFFNLSIIYALYGFLLPDHFLMNISGQPTIV